MLEKRASFDEWMRWAAVLLQRLTTVHSLYIQHMRMTEAASVDHLVVRLRHALGMDEDAQNDNDAAYAHLAHQLHQAADDTSKIDELRIQTLADIFRDALAALPEISIHMQQLLHSNWRGDCNGRVASDLFKGPHGKHHEGIGSGWPLDGQLPEIMDSLLEREAQGGDRLPRSKALSAEEAHRRNETSRRWAQRNASYLRSAGRVE